MNQADGEALTRKVIALLESTPKDFTFKMQNLTFGEICDIMTHIDVLTIHAYKNGHKKKMTKLLILNNKLLKMGAQRMNESLKASHVERLSHG